MQNIQPLCLITIKLGKNILNKIWTKKKPKQQLQDFWKLFMRVVLEQHPSSQNRETG